MQNSQGETPSHIAVKYKHLPILEILIQHPAWKDAKDKSGQTALQLAINRQNESMATVIIERLLHGLEDGGNDLTGKNFLDRKVGKDKNEDLLIEGTACATVANESHHPETPLPQFTASPMHIKDILGECFRSAAAAGLVVLIEKFLQKGAIRVSKLSRVYVLDAAINRARIL